MMREINVKVKPTVYLDGVNVSGRRLGRNGGAVPVILFRSINVRTLNIHEVVYAHLELLVRLHIHPSKLHPSLSSVNPFQQQRKTYDVRMSRHRQLSQNLIPQLLIQRNLLRPSQKRRYDSEGFVSEGLVVRRGGVWVE